MKNKLLAMSMLLMLFASVMPLSVSSGGGGGGGAVPSLVVDDAINRINATLGVKSGSVITAVGTVTNIGTSSLSGLLTAIFIREDAHGLVPSDITGEWSPDGISWYPMAAAVTPVPAEWDIELTLGPSGGYPLAVNGSSTTYVRLTAHKDVGTSSATPLHQTVAVVVYRDNDNSYSYSSGEPIYSQPGTGNDWDDPVKIDLAIVHTAEIEGTGQFYYSIQDAVNAATSTTIILYPGTYSPFTVSGKSSLTIVATGPVVVKGSQSVVTNYANRDAVIFIEDSVDITLDGLDIEGQGLGTTNPKSYGVIYESSSGTIKDCIVSPNTIGDMNGVAIGAWDDSDLTVDPCIIKNFGRIGVFYFSGCSGGVYDSTIIGQVYSGEGEVNYGVEIEAYDEACDIEIIRNDIYNCDNTHPSPLWSSAGIVIDGWLALMATPSSTVVIEENDIYGNYYGIEVVANPYSYAHYNNIYNNREYGVVQDPDYAGNNATFDARFNWWGGWSGPFHNDTNLMGAHNKVTDNVTYSPWLGFVAGTTPMTYHVNPTGKIQDAIDDASSGDTILVHSGTYNEALYIDKTLTIKAASKPIVKGSQSVTTNYGDRDAVIFVENAADVTIEGLDIQGEGLGTTNTKSYAVIFEASSGTIKDCIISPNTIGDMYGTAIGVWDGSDLTVDPCTIENFGRIGVFYFNGCSGGVYDSTIIGQVYSNEGWVNYGIEVEGLYGACDIEIVGNEIYNCDNTYSPEPLWSSAAIMIDGWLGITGYSAYMQSSTVVMKYNDIHNNYYGIEVIANSLSYARCNKIYDNRKYGVISEPDEFGSYVVFNATWNWWGSDTGPYHPTTNPGGTGDEVSDYVDYEPWKTHATLKVEPSSYQAKHINETFNIDITINNLSENWKFVSVEFRLCYNSTLLEVLSVTEGPFVEQAGLTFFVYYIEDDEIYGPHVLVGILLMPPWTAFPHGSGTLATITFNASYWQRNLLVSCDLTLLSTILVNSDVEDVLHNVENGYYEILLHLCDLNLDGWVDMRDISTAARAFGSYPGHPRWDPYIDINGDGRVDMRDIATVARNFGWDC